MSLPSYRGDIVNGMEFTPEARRPDPRRMIQAYSQAAATLTCSAPLPIADEARHGG